MTTKITINQDPTHQVNNGLGALLKEGTSRVGSALKRAKPKLVGSAPSPIMGPGPGGMAGGLVQKGMSTGTKGLLGQGGKMSKSAKVGGAVLGGVGAVGAGAGITGLATRKKKKRS